MVTKANAFSPPEVCRTTRWPPSDLERVSVLLRTPPIGLNRLGCHARSSVSRVVELFQMCEAAEAKATSMGPGYLVKFGHQQVGTRNFAYGAVISVEVVPDA